MSCEYCMSKKNMMRDSCSDVSIGKDDDVYRIYYLSGSRLGSTEPIRFCPMCGERFPEIVRDSFESIKQDMTLSVCVYAKKRGIGHGVKASDKQASCTNCEWGNGENVCGWLMRNDLADRLGKLINEETER